METQIKMISAATAVLSLRKQNPLAIDEEVFQHIADKIARERIKDEKIKIAMIAAASEAFKISRQNSNLTEKEILRQVMENIPNLLANLEGKN